MKNKNMIQYLQDYGSFIALIFLVIVIGAISPDFRTVNNFLSLLRQSAINGLIAFGMTCVILTGGIDLSVGSVLALTSIICAHTIKIGLPAPLSMLIALIFGIILGTISGLMVTKSRLQPFIATLITMTGYRGLTMILSGGKPISRLGNNLLLNQIGKGSFLGIPVPVWILIIFFAIFLFVLKKTVLGRQIYATGSNAKAAELAGININNIKLIVYAVSGFMASLSGLILVSRLGSAQPTLGSGYELDAIAAVALGGTSMTGGRGKITGSLIGILIIAVLNNGLNIIGVSSYYQDVVKALVIFLAVISDRNR
ncbi:ABC transporter permease subunit [Brachyspira aalborgi]|jgi:ribose transport system permease protein|uniref:Ribose ABC transporter permease n=1 Tax=Brachyspira aalborgi TaxID=29522 RepID=A0AB38PX67_9SPIR|nr:ribose ABC transporter permease [Brachyspira aalborgi]MBS4763654.1 ribose ABC transporter permease [Brachyspira sp.]TXJ24596.1 ribose ABC transporter permease [Brachyspira aalborgi]TXJ32912.1 ribose ABC transporter permease [Brachyspira aalborgi]TXJ41703.1 ribose ABC transporter permease [Brachyspira aalborgi]